MIRTFHSIGQGAFYTEVYDKFNVVYDCGSSTNINLLIEKIRNTFNCKEKIDLLFISHFHEDHINGLDFLLDYCDVRYIILPLQYEIDKVYTLIDNYYNSYNGNGIIMNPKEFIGERAKIIFVNPVEHDKSSDGIDNTIYIEDLYKIDTINSGTRIMVSQGDNWFFIPFNFRHESRAKVLNDKLKSVGININSINDFVSCWNDESIRENIITCYRKVPGDFNTNSLTLYSGPVGDTKLRSYFSSCHFGCRGYCIHKHRDSGCLYLGDYNANGKSKWGQLESKYNFIWNNIGIIQIPHHGSHHNFTSNITNKKSNIISIISAGYKNQYRHPHSKVLNHLDAGSFDYYLVNEYKISEVRAICNID